MEKTIKQYRKTINIKRWSSSLLKLIPILLGLISAGLFIWAIMRKSDVVGYGWCVKLFLCGLVFVSLTAVGYFVYLLVKDTNKYTAVINRLDVLVIRINLKENGDLQMTDIDRELQLISRMLQLS